MRRARAAATLIVPTLRFQRNSPLKGGGIGVAPNLRPHDEEEQEKGGDLDTPAVPALPAPINISA